MDASGRRSLEDLIEDPFLFKWPGGQDWTNYILQNSHRGLDHSQILSGFGEALHRTGFTWDLRTT